MREKEDENHISEGDILKILLEYQQESNRVFNKLDEIETLPCKTQKKSSNKMLPPVSIEPLDLLFQVQYPPFLAKC